MILCMAATGIIPEFSLADLTEESFKSKTNIRRSQDLLKQEILKCDTGRKGIAKLSVAELLNDLSGTNVTTMTHVCIAYVRA